MMDLALAEGVEDLTVAMVVERAGVDPAFFAREYGSLEDCYVKVYEENTEEFESVVMAAFDGPRAWRDRLRAAAYATARFIRDHPRYGAFGVVRMFSAGDIAQVYRERQLQRMVDLIDLGRQELDDPDSMSRRIAEGVVGAIYARVIDSLQDDGAIRSVEDFVPDLMYVAVRPYLGHEAALEELSIPPPKERPKGGG
jgi:AcrR family transcriptional regulator